MTRQLAASWRLGAPVEASGAVVVPRISAIPRRRLRERRPLFWISLALHMLAVAAIFLAPAPKPPDDDMGQPSISVVLAPGDMPANPVPTPQAAIGTPEAETVQRAAPPDSLPPLPPGAVEQPQSAPVERPVPPLAFAPQAEPPPPPQPTLPSQAEAPQQPSPPPQAFAPPQLTPQPQPAAPPVAVTPVPEPDLPVPPVPPSVIPPPPAPTPPPPRVREALVQPPPVRTPPRPQASERPAPAPRRTAPSGFPMPMFSSLGGALPQSREAARAPSREMAGPVKPSSTSSYMPQLDVSGDDLGADYNELLHRFWTQHAYYPRGAAENNEDGSVAVKVVIDRYGKVKSLSLISRSGSVFLDAAGQATWRDHQLPPLPSNWHGDEATLFINMHYILLH